MRDLKTLFSLGLFLSLLWLQGCSDSLDTDAPPPSTETPPLAELTSAAPPDFSQFAAGPARKQAFFDYFVPLIDQGNQQIMHQRKRLLRLIDQIKPTQPLPDSDQAWLLEKAQAYQVPFESAAPLATLKRLKPKLDKVPVSLALAQAANESAWGTSRFARDGHNYFGQWCYTPGCGLVPKQRAKTAKHEVKRFSHPFASVKSYLRNLNTHPAYRPFRQIRAQQRAQKQPLDAARLAQGLKQYSQRGLSYVEELQAMIRYNQLTRYDASSKP